MPQPPLKRELAVEAVERVEAKLREGYRPRGSNGSGPGAVAVAAAEAVDQGWCNSISAFETRLRIAEAAHKLEPDWTLFTPRQYRHRSPGAPVIPDQSHLAEPDPEGEPELVCFIGDAHDSPHLRDKSRFRWLGEFAAEHGVKRVIQVGDWWTMDCFSSHTDRATFQGLAKPTFDQDRDSFHESAHAFREGLAGHKPLQDVTLGNHEERAWRYDNLHPDGLSHSHLVEEAFMQWGWRTTRYGQYRFFSGVGVVHTPLNGRGKPLAQTQRVNKAMFDTVHGDDHRALQLSDFKSGPFRSPTVYSAATALPPGYIEGFAGTTGSTWRSGVCLAHLWDGYVRSWSFTEMILLRKRYGRAGDGPKLVTGWAA